MKLYRICFYFLVFFGISCGVQKDMLIKVSYTDQNNNRYLLTENTFSYIPITENESSSGTYNGGEPVSKTITASEFKKVLELAEDIIATVAKDMKREMLTSVLSITRDQSTERVTLRKSAKRTQLEALLLAIKTASE